ASRMPETTASAPSLRLRGAPPGGALRSASTLPIRIIEKTSRHAAIESAGAVARRTSGPAQDTARTATTSAAHGETGGAAACGGRSRGEACGAVTVGK